VGEISTSPRRGIADNGRRMAQPRGVGTVAAREVRAFREITTNINDRSDQS
jgi:hypothetical protein